MEAAAATTATGVKQVGKMGKYGMVELGVLEARDVKCSYCTVATEFFERTTKHQKNPKNPKFDEVFTIPISRATAVISVTVWKKAVIGKDTCIGYFGIPVKDIPHTEGTSEQSSSPSTSETPSATTEQVKPKTDWFPLVKPHKSQLNLAGTDIIAAPNPQQQQLAAAPQQPQTTTTAVAAAAGGDDSGDDEEEQQPAAATTTETKQKKKKKVEKGDVIGSIRLSLLLRLPEPEKPKVVGLIMNGEFSAAQHSDGGNLTGNPHWFDNHQYLLTVGTACSVTVTLDATPLIPGNSKDSLETVTFYLLRYDDELYRMRRKPVFTTDEIIKTEADFLCPVFAKRVEFTYAELPAGLYCLIPCLSSKSAVTETPQKPLKYQLVANTRDLSKITLKQLPLAEDWRSDLKASGQWAEESGGGADLGSTSWTKNPQFLFRLTCKSDFCIVLNQPTNKNSIGFYCIMVDDSAITHKAVVYKSEVASTPKCVFGCSVGQTVKNAKPGNYLIIPCTFEAHQLGEFELRVLCVDPQASLAPLVKEWAHKKLAKCEWSGSLAGGSPNNDSFVNNPQFLLTISPDSSTSSSSTSSSSGSSVPFVLNLVQRKTKKSKVDLAPIGITVFKAHENNTSEIITLDDLDPKNVIQQTEGWVPQRTVSIVGNVAVPNGAKMSFIVIPSTFNPGMQHKFSLTAYSDSSISLTCLTKHEDPADDAEDK